MYLPFYPSKLAPQLNFVHGGFYNTDDTSESTLSHQQTLGLLLQTAADYSSGCSDL